MSEVRRWLEGIGLSQYADAFRANDIDLLRIAGYRIGGKQSEADIAETTRLTHSRARAHEYSIMTKCLRSPAGRIESWRRGAGSRSPTIVRYALR
jgi:hypothetical protein